MLDCLSACSEDLAATLDRAHEKGGNPGYPARQMLRLQLLRYLLGERYANRFLNRVGNDPRLLELCGMSNVPSERAFSDFKNHKLAPRQEELDRISAAVVEDCAGLMEELKESGAIPADAPALGEILAVDATDIPAYANPNCETPADCEAAWGYRPPKSKSPQAESGRKDLFFGYGADVISDAHYGLPLYLNVRPANRNEGPLLRADLDAALKLHPWLRPRCRTADRGYHAGYNFRHLADLGITPVIAIPKPPQGWENRETAVRGPVQRKGASPLHRGRSHGFPRDRGGREAPVPLPRGGLPTEEPNGLEPLL